MFALVFMHFSAHAQEKDGPMGLTVDDVAVGPVVEVDWRGSDTIVRLRLYEKDAPVVHRGGMVMRTSELMAPIVGVPEGDEIVYAVPAYFTAPFTDVRVRVGTRHVTATVGRGDERRTVLAVPNETPIRFGELYDIRIQADLKKIDTY